MDWYELDYKIEDGFTINHSNDGHTQDRNLKDIFNAIKIKINMNDCDITSLQSELMNLRHENAELKRMLLKVLKKDYPELAIEEPSFFDETIRPVTFL